CAPRACRTRSASTFRASPRAPSSTRASSSRSRSRPSTTTSPTRSSSRRWRSSTSASRPTPSRPGTARTPTASSRTTARSTPPAGLEEAWDGAASLAVTDGRVIGAVLDRNGLRPSRYVVTKDGFVVMASEVGVLDILPENVLHKDRLQPGRMFLVDTEQGRIVGDEELKEGMAARRPYRKWLDANLTRLAELPPPERVPPDYEPETFLPRQQAFGYTIEDLRLLMTPMALNAQEAVGSMGTDTPLACLSDRPQLLFNYFKQLFAQVTNPPIDPI